MTGAKGAAVKRRSGAQADRSPHVGVAIFHPVEVLAGAGVAIGAQDHGLMDGVAVGRADGPVEVALAIALNVSSGLVFEPAGILLRVHLADQKLRKLPLDALGVFIADKP